MRRIITIWITLVLSLGVYAQKKEMAQAKEFVKKGTNLPQAESLMKNLLKDSANRTNEKIWLILFEAQKKQYDQGNEKMYLKQQLDTATLFDAAKRMFKTLEGLDSVDMMPDEKGKVKLAYRKKHAELLNVYRKNLFNGGAFFINQKKYKEAYEYFDLYIDCARQPLFTDYKYDETDTAMPEAAYWAVYCGYKIQDPKATLHHTYLALKDTAHHQYMLQYLAETYKLEKDDKRYVEALTEGFRRYPKFQFFFPRLIEYYAETGEWSKALEVCDEGLAKDSTNVLYRFSKSSVLLSMKRYDECVAICKSLLAECDTLYGVHLNAGLAYFNKAVEMEKNISKQSSRRKEINQLYKEALPYIEKYRAKAPEQKQMWGLPLYTIYLNLNMGKEFEEIDKLMR